MEKIERIEEIRQLDDYVIILFRGESGNLSVKIYKNSSECRGMVKILQIINSNYRLSIAPTEWSYEYQLAKMVLDKLDERYLSS